MSIRHAPLPQRAGRSLGGCAQSHRHCPSDSFGLALLLYPLSFPHGCIPDPEVWLHVFRILLCFCAHIVARVRPTSPTRPVLLLFCASWPLHTFLGVVRRSLSVLRVRPVFVFKNGFVALLLYPLSFPHTSYYHR